MKVKFIIFGNLNYDFGNQISRTPRAFQWDSFPLLFFFLEGEHNVHSVSLTYIDGSVEPRIAHVSLKRFFQYGNRSYCYSHNNLQIVSNCVYLSIPNYQNKFSLSVLISLVLLDKFVMHPFQMSQYLHTLERLRQELRSILLNVFVAICTIEL